MRIRWLDSLSISSARRFISCHTLQSLSLPEKSLIVCTAFNSTEHFRNPNRIDVSFDVGRLQQGSSEFEVSRQKLDQCSLALVARKGNLSVNDCVFETSERQTPAPICDSVPPGGIYVPLARSDMAENR